MPATCPATMPSPVGAHAGNRSAGWYRPGPQVCREDWSASLATRAPEGLEPCS